MYLKGHYQNAYVTHDIEAAKAALGNRYGLDDFLCIEADMVVSTPSGPQPSYVRAAFAWVGNLQLELIQPVSGFAEAYLPFLPDDKADASPRFHHMAVRRDDPDAMRAEIGRLGLPVAFENATPEFHFVYVDARATLGHYLEYMWALPELWTMLRWPAGLCAA